MVTEDNRKRSRDNCQDKIICYVKVQSVTGKIQNSLQQLKKPNAYLTNVCYGLHHIHMNCNILKYKPVEL